MTNPSAMKLKGTLFEDWTPPTVMPPPAVPIRGHAERPGDGPDGEICKTCRHYTLLRWAGTYRKCGLMEAHWTKGGATDIRAGDPACERWSAK